MQPSFEMEKETSGSIFIEPFDMLTLREIRYLNRNPCALGASSGKVDNYELESPNSKFQTIKCDCVAQLD